MDPFNFMCEKACINPGGREREITKEGNITGRSHSGVCLCLAITHLTSPFFFERHNRFSFITIGKARGRAEGGGSRRGRLPVSGDLSNIKERFLRSHGSARTSRRDNDHLCWRVNGTRFLQNLIALGYQMTEGHYAALWTRLLFLNFSQLNSLVQTFFMAFQRRTSNFFLLTII